MKTTTARTSASSRSLMLALVAALSACGNSIEVEEALDDGEVDQARVKLVNAPLPVHDGARGGGITAQDAGQGGTFVYVASVDAPKVAGLTVQATNFAFDGPRAYVVYNTAGVDIRGGIETVDLSNPSAPRLLASAVSEGIEFADVVVRNAHAYAVGTNDRGAVLAIYDVGTPNRLRQVGSLALPSHSGTSIVFGSANDVWITTGVGGGLVHVDIASPTNPVVLGSQPLSNALYVLEMEGTKFVLGGDALSVYRSKDGGEIASAAPVSGSFAEAPGRLARRDHQLFTNAGRTGLTEFVVTSNGRVVTKVRNTALEGTGNGIDASVKHLFLAQGEKGTLVYEFLGQGTPKLLGTFDFPDDKGSANQVRVKAGTGGKTSLFLSDGLGGFRIVVFGE